MKLSGKPIRFSCRCRLIANEIVLEAPFATGNVQQVAVEFCAPFEIESCIAECGVKRDAMTVPFGLGKSPVHVE